MGIVGTSLTCANTPTCSPHPHTHIHARHIHATYTDSAIFKRQSSKSVRVSEKARAKIFPHVRHLVESDRKRILVSSLTLTLLNHCVCSLVSWPHLKYQEKGLVTLAKFLVCAESAYYVTAHIYMRSHGSWLLLTMAL